MIFERSIFPPLALFPLSASLSPARLFTPSCLLPFRPIQRTPPCALLCTKRKRELSVEPQAAHTQASLERALAN